MVVCYCSVINNKFKNGYSVKPPRLFRGGFVLMRLPIPVMGSFEGLGKIKSIRKLIRTHNQTYREWCEGVVALYGVMGGDVRAKTTVFYPQKLIPKTVSPGVVYCPY